MKSTQSFSCDYNSQGEARKNPILGSGMGCTPQIQYQPDSKHLSARSMAIIVPVLPAGEIKVR